MYQKIIALVLLLLCLSGCDFGLEVVGIQINQYPDNIVYYSDVDTELDLSGGTVGLCLKDGTVSAFDMSDARQVTVTDNVNFNLPGVYAVTLSRNGYSCAFPIQVLP